MNEGEIKSQVASPEARKACALELRSEHKLHATKHGQVKILLFNNNNINNWFIKN